MMRTRYIEATPRGEINVRLVYAALGMLLVAGCAKPMEVGSITEIKPPPGAQGVDVFAAQRASGAVVPELAGDQIVDIRTYNEAEAAKPEEEFAGANCKLSAQDYSADLTTPAKVRVPLYRGQSSTLAVTCEKPGYVTKLQQAAVYNETAQQRIAMGSSRGLIGVALALAVNGVSDTAKDDYKYPIVRIVMAKKIADSTRAAMNKQP